MQVEAEILENLEGQEANVQLPREDISVDILKRQINIKEKILNLVHVNIRSVKKNFDNLLVFLQTFELYYCDVIVLSESFQISHDHFNIPGYNFHYNNADSNRNDGVIIYTKENLNIHVFNHKLLRSSVTLSKITFLTQNVTFGVTCLYRPPSTGEGPFIEEIENYFVNNLREQVEIFVGDINLDICDHNNEHVNLYLSTLSQFGFVPFINCHTRVTSTTASCIDHIFVRQKSNINKLGYQSFVLDSDLTDHYPVMLNVLMEPGSKYINHSNKIVERKVTEIDYNKFLELLQAQDWHPVVNSNDSEVATNTFYRLFMSSYENARRHRVVRVLEHKKIKPWITNGIITSIKHRDKIKKRLLHCQDVELKNHYKIYRNCLNKIIIKCKNDYYKNVIQNNETDIKKIYKMVSDATNEHKTTGNQNINIFHNESKFETDKDMANYCNSFFVNIGKHMAEKISPTTDKFFGHTLAASMFLRPVSSNELIRHINSLKNNSAPGIDGIPSRIIKAAHIHILPSLSHIVNLVFKTGIVPAQFKTTLVCPIHKAGSKNDINNFRPISLINNFGKIFEKCLKERLIKFFDENKILSKNQFGFVSGLSTSDAMCELVGQITANLNTGRRSIAVFLDLAKAFDTVPHDRLLNVLERYGVRGAVLGVFVSYLTDRKQIVKIRSTYSDDMIVKIGVPQGTVLGPILFITYINSLTNLDINGTIVSYADDTVLLFSGNSWDEARERTELGLTEVKNWLDCHKLTLNLNKTHYIAFSITSVNRPDFSSIHPRNFENSIKEVSNTKYLGIIIDRHLKWEAHIFKLNNSIRKLIHKFYLLREILSKNLLMMIYKALVESLIRYGIVVWGGLYNSALRQLNVTQNFILKVIHKKKKRFPTHLLYSEDVFSVRSLYILAACLYVYGERSKDYVKHRHETRSKTQKNLRIPMSYRDVNQRFLTYLGPKFYNLLPVDVREIKSKRAFIKGCRVFIFQNKTDFEKII